VEAFARAAGLELPRGIRINAVSPPWVSETLASMGRDPAGGLSAEKVARAYVESVEGRRNGEVLDARRFA
jgi:NAD(P)-dependent dehydrogenase (short-subunit alcohol dehydrogenase family)